MKARRSRGTASIDGRLLAVLAMACGVAGANIYYSQPLLPEIADHFHTGSGTVGLTVTASQLGYALSLALLVPLGDLLDRRRLVPIVVAGTAVALLAAAAAPGVAVLIVVTVFIGAGSVVTHVLIPLAAELSANEERGRVVGTMVTGLLCGVLLARTAAGLISDLAGWRAVYVVAAGLMVALALALRRELPSDGQRPHIPYGQLLRSTLELFKRERVLRLRCLYGFLAFAAVASFWTTIAFLLKDPPYGYSDSVIGLFGLIGAAGAVAANVSGRLADRGLTRAATGVFALTIAGSFVLLGVGRHSLVAVLVAVLTLDAAVNGIHVLNQHTNYALPAAAEARSRTNAAYMVGFFLGGASGSAVSAAVYSSAGWTGVCVLGTALGLVTTALWLWKGAVGEGRRTTRDQPPPTMLGSI